MVRSYELESDNEDDNYKGVDGQCLIMHVSLTHNLE